MVNDDEQAEELTFGQQAVGLNFNHAEGDVHDKVHKLKSLYAEIIDILHAERTGGVSPEVSRHAAVAITDTETAQMRAVKAVTFGQ